MDFIKRHIGCSDKDVLDILKTLNVSSLEELTDQILPQELNKKPSFSLDKALSEAELLKEVRKIANKNQIFKNYIGMGYKKSFTPPAIQRHILENPVWYSSYTPYQSELAQGRLEALLNFQTMIADLTGMEIANASLLDEGTALAEALTLAGNADTKKQSCKKVFIDSRVFPQSLEVIKTRSQSLGWDLVIDRFENFKGAKNCWAAILQYPSADGSIPDIQNFLQKMKKEDCFTIVASDLLSLCLLKAPGEFYTSDFPAGGFPAGSSSMDQNSETKAIKEENQKNTSQKNKMGANQNETKINKTDIKAVDVVVGSSQNFGIPLFFGGPHAAFFAAKKEFIRLIPGRIAGVSKDRHEKQAYRLSLQTREQHIRREKATSNICTAQSLLAVMAGFYAVYHGPKKLKKIAEGIHDLTKKLFLILQNFKEVQILNESFFDTLRFRTPSVEAYSKLKQKFLEAKINLHSPEESVFSITWDETCSLEDLKQIKNILESVLEKKITSLSSSDSPASNSPALSSPASVSPALSSPASNSPASNSSALSSPASNSPASNSSALSSPASNSNVVDNSSLSESNSSTASSKTENQQKAPIGIKPEFLRKSSYLTHPVFNSYHSETELTRYIHRLQNKELSLTHSMIPLGSCTMKLNAVTELTPVSWPEFADIHPFAPSDQTQGYQKIIQDLERQLCEITGFHAFSFQPNAGSQGEYAGLMAIKKYFESKKQTQRNICLIPVSAHGTNPASAIMTGFEVKALRCKPDGRIDLEDFESQLQQYKNRLAAIMITYPSTYGFFEEVKEICNRAHEEGGFVYLDGANMNALLGLVKPAELGFDVCHLNLHKSFCIPHGGGGPGAGPVGVNEKLKDFLPGHSHLNQKTKLGAVSSAPYGNAGILVISWAYIKMMGLEGLRKSAQIAMANANYIAEKLKDHYRILYKGSEGRTAHECIIDLRKFKNTANITVDDVAKRLMDYSFHSPTMSWPVPGTLMIEPTESENKAELDRFCSALISIRKEIKDIEEGKSKGELLKSAPHNIIDLMEENWTKPYSKKQAFYPLDWLYERKFWTPVSRIENAYGDINPFCSCPPVS